MPSIRFQLLTTSNFACMILTIFEHYFTFIQNMSFDTRSGCVYRYNAQTDKLHMSYTVVKRSKLSLPGRLVIDVFRLLRLVHVRKSKAGSEEVIECSNMTIINLALNVLGPTHEASLTTYLLIVQVCIGILLTEVNRHPTISDTGGM